MSSAAHLVVPEVLRPTCPGCGAKGPFTLFAEAHLHLQRLTAAAYASRKIPEYMHHRLVTCGECDLLFANPVPSIGQLQKAYGDATFDSSEEARWASRTYACLIDEILPYLPSRDGVLDIGTGEGSLLEEFLARGMTRVSGVEPSAAPIAAARPTVRSLIRHGIFEPKQYQPQSFVLITCLQTLEHVAEPLDLVKGVHRLLVTGGTFVAVCHNRRALSARLLGKRSPIFDVEHLQLFSPMSAKVLFKAAGYKDVRTAWITNTYPLHYWLRLLPLPSCFKKPLLRWLRGSWVGHIAVKIPAGNLIIFGIK